MVVTGIVLNVALFCLQSHMAATIVALDDAELVKQADGIGYGVILKTTSRWGGDGVKTIASLQLYGALRGLKSGEVISVEVPGGELPNGLRSVVAGAPQLSAGDMVFGFFLKRGESYVPWGLSYGLLRLAKTASGVGYRVFRDIDGLVMVDSIGQRLAREPIRLEGVLLDDYVERLRRFLDGHRVNDELGSTDGGVLP